MKRQAKVVCEDGVYKAEIIRPDACGSCRACQMGRTERLLMDLPPGAYYEGQAVELSLPDGQVGKASLIAYGIPLAGFALGLFIGWRLGLTELYQALCAIVLLALSALGVKLLEPRLRKSGAFNPTATPCAYGFTQDKEHQQ